TLHGEIGGLATRDAARQGRRRALDRGWRTGRAFVFEQYPADLVRADIAERHQHVQVGVAGQVEALARRREIGAEQPEPAQFLVEQFLAGRFVARAVELVEP